MGVAARTDPVGKGDETKTFQKHLRLVSTEKIPHTVEKMVWSVV